MTVKEVGARRPSRRTIATMPCNREGLKTCATKSRSVSPRFSPAWLVRRASQVSATIVAIACRAGCT